MNKCIQKYQCTKAFLLICLFVYFLVVLSTEDVMKAAYASIKSLQAPRNSISLQHYRVSFSLHDIAKMEE